MEIIKAVLTGIVEGITEWLPVSSTGHMIILEKIIHFNMTDNFMEMFRVIIQLGAVMAVIAVYFKKLWPFSVDKSLHYIKKDVIMMWLKIAAACIPAVLAGLLLDDWIDTYLYNYRVVAIMLITYGALFFIIDRDRKPKIKTMVKLTFKDAFIIGIWQMLALIPGTSRSGATVLGGILLGISRPLAAQFTFYLSVPVMFGASGLKIAKYFAYGGVLSGTETAVIFSGMTAAFIVSMFTIRFLMNYVKNHSFRVFGWYRIGLGLLVLLSG